MFRSYRQLRHPPFLALAVVFLLVGTFGLLQTIPLSYAQSQPDVLGTLSGAVRNESGDPLPNISVYISDMRSTKTDAQGFYQFLSVFPGAYPISFEDDANVYAKTFYANGSLPSEATPVNISGNTVTGIDVVMRPAGTLAVTIDSALSYSLTGITTILFRKTATNRWEEYDRVRWDNSESEAQSEITSDFHGIANGTYGVCVSVEPYPFAQGQSECYDNVRPGNPLEGHKEIVVTPGSYQTIALLLGDFHQLQGVVRSTAGEPLAHGTVYAFNHGLGHDPYRVKTDSQGHFYFDGLEEDTYTVQAFAPSHLPIFYDGATTHEEAIHLKIGPASRYSLTLILRLGGSITGVVQLEGGGIPAQAEVQALPVDSAGNIVEPEYPSFYSTYIDPATGAYTITAIETGTYRVKAAFRYGGYEESDYITGFFGGEDFDSADDVFVTAGNTTPNISLTLGTGKFEGTIMGNVTADGLPKAGIEVGLWGQTDQDIWEDRQPTVATLTDAQGTYSFNGLADGFYIVGFRDPLGDYAITFFGGDHFSPTSVIISGGETQENVNAQLILGSTIRGKIRRAAGENPADFRLRLRSASNVVPLRYVDVVSDVNGDYEIAGVPPGNYMISATAPYPSADYKSRQIVVGENVLIEGVDFVIEALPSTFLPLLKNNRQSP